MRLVHERTLIFALIENIRVREQNFVLPVTVVEHQDTQPLFGIPWILAMNFNMPPGVSFCQRKLSALSTILLTV
ncbi:hypothetical protein GJ496_009377 [Pomphorhynchus laevis]|nr:hypothetical protein GJ496_009377 [Pomphorhynchus laevis]